MALDVRGMAPLISVFDMPTALKFYCEGLGFTIAQTDGKPAPNFDWVMLRLNGTELMLNTAYDGDERPPRPDAERIAAHGDMTLYFGCPEVDAAYAELKGKGLAVKEPKVSWYGMYQMYVTDPDGWQLCFQWGAQKKASAD